MPPWRHRRDQVVVRDALEQRQAADQRVGLLEAGWYHPPPIGALCWMAKFDISPGNCAATIRRPGVAQKQTTSPPRYNRVYGLILSGCAFEWVCRGVDRPGKFTPRRVMDGHPRVFPRCNARARGRLRADSYVSRSARTHERRRRGVRPPSWDLDGMYLWLGPERRRDP